MQTAQCPEFVMSSCQIVTSSLLLRMISGGIVHFSTHEDNTKETRSCPIVLRRHHDYVKPSQYCDVGSWEICRHNLQSIEIMD